ncbi:hypothetical protein ECANGB1_475 [Enterospora canceri]|uniref:Uncharacterized protein n=1 Tax=Enterospora canceri TaxID=1081671 RepID=A0A1Y1S817_9MICR|nr:hypothetical protein ECANGB1_475 [Enterospora canceri]
MRILKWYSDAMQLNRLKQGSTNRYSTPQLVAFVLLHYVAVQQLTSLLFDANYHNNWKAQGINYLVLGTAFVAYSLFMKAAYAPRKQNSTNLFVATLLSFSFYPMAKLPSEFILVPPQTAIFTSASLASFLVAQNMESCTNTVTVLNTILSILIHLGINTIFCDINRSIFSRIKIT